MRLAAVLSAKSAEANGAATPEAVNVVEPEAEAEVEGATNVWPDEAAEAAFLAEQGSATESAGPVAKPVAEAKEVAEVEKPLPKLDELLRQISPETRELLDDLFRARFTGVRRVPRKALKV